MTMSISQTISSYFDGDLQLNEGLGLRAWLLESKANVDNFVVDCFVHTQLVDLLSAHQVRADALVASVGLPSSARASRKFRVPGRVLAIAGSILFVSLMTYFVVLRPAVVATVSGTGNVQWAAGTEKRTVGSLLREGNELALDRGTLNLTFA